MRDWEAFVRGRLRLPGLKPEREMRIVRELAAQLEDFYHDARADGASDEKADAYAARQVEDWDRFALDVSPHARRPDRRRRRHRGRAVSRLMRTMLFEGTEADPASYAATALMLLAVAALACYVPARRAMRLDPLSALRQD